MADPIVFVTCPEATVAGEAGLRTCIVMRDSNDSLSEDDFQNFHVIYGLNELLEDDENDDDVPVKRKYPGGDVYDDYISTDGATNDSEPVLSVDDDGDVGEEEPTGESENGESQDA